MGRSVQKPKMTELPSWGASDLGGALAVLARFNITPDVQELLIYGNPSRGVPPGALAAVLKALAAQKPPASS